MLRAGGGTSPSCTHPLGCQGGPLVQLSLPCPPPPPKVFGPDKTLERKPLLSLLSTESSSRSKNGSCGHFERSVFSKIYTMHLLQTFLKNPMTHHLRLKNCVVAGAITDTHRHTHRTITVTLRHMRACAEG